MKFTATLLTILVLAGALFGITSCTVSGFGRGTSEGVRTGYITQFSKTGFWMKSYETDLKIATPGQTTGYDHWESSAFVDEKDSDKIAKALQDALTSGHKVTIRYTEWTSKPAVLSTHFEIVEVIDEEAGETCAPLMLPIKHPVVCDVSVCARCGLDHGDVKFLPFTEFPPPKYSHFFLCPTNSEPVLAWFEEDDAPSET